MTAIFIATMAITIGACIAQIVGFTRQPTSLAAQVTRVLALVFWVLGIGAAQLGLLKFNYCENNCQMNINAPTAGILITVLLINITIVWLTLIFIPRKFKRDHPY